MHNVSLALQFTFHHQQLCAQDLLAVLVKQTFPDDQVGKAGFILDGDKTNPARGAGPLPDGDDARDFYPLVARRFADLFDG